MIDYNFLLLTIIEEVLGLKLGFACLRQVAVVGTHAASFSGAAAVVILGALVVEVLLQVPIFPLSFQIFASTLRSVSRQICVLCIAKLLLATLRKTRKIKRYLFGLGVLIINA